MSKSKCYNCHLGHHKRDCKETKQNLDFTCFKCGPPGHVALNCDKDQLPEWKVQIKKIQTINNSSNSENGGNYPFTALIDIGASLSTIKATAV